MLDDIPTPCKLPAPERFVRNHKAKDMNEKPIVAAAYVRNQIQASDSLCKHQSFSQLCKSCVMHSMDPYDLLFNAITVDVIPYEDGCVGDGMGMIGDLND